MIGAGAVGERMNQQRGMPEKLKSGELEERIYSYGETRRSFAGKNERSIQADGMEIFTIWNCHPLQITPNNVAASADMTASISRPSVRSRKEQNEGEQGKICECDFWVWRIQGVH